MKYQINGPNIYSPLYSGSDRFSKKETEESLDKLLQEAINCAILNTKSQINKILKTLASESLDCYRGKSLQTAANDERGLFTTNLRRELTSFKRRVVYNRSITSFLDTLPKTYNWEALGVPKMSSYIWDKEIIIENDPKRIWKFDYAKILSMCTGTFLSKPMDYLTEQTQLIVNDIDILKTLTSHAQQSNAQADAGLKRLALIQLDIETSISEIYAH